MATHRAVLLDQPGSPIRVGSRATPIPQAGFVLVKVIAVAVNRMDHEVVETGHFIVSYPAVIGLDASGIIVQVGEGVTNLKVGDEVFFRGNYYNPDEATFQEFCVVQSDLVAIKPASLNLDHEDLAGIPTASFAAFTALFHRTGANIPPPLCHAQITGQRDPVTAGEYGPSIVILGGSSSVGQFLIQFARMSGFTTVITTASENHRKRLIEDLGATHVLDRDTSPAEIMRLALADPHQWKPDPAKGATPVVVDAISSVETQEYGITILSDWSALGGTLISMSTARPRDIPPTMDVRGVFSIPFVQRDLSVRFYQLMPDWLNHEEIVPNPIITDFKGLESIPQALEAIQIGNLGGRKLVIRISEQPEDQSGHI